MPPLAPTAADARARRLARNPALLCAHHALMMSLFPMAILTVFQRDHLGLSVAEIMFVQAAFGGALALFEFPSGYLADRIGYRPTMILASCLAVVGWGIYCFATGLGSVLAAEMSMGLALSLVSGTNAAMLYESLEETERPHEFARWNSLMRFWGQLSEGTAALVAGAVFAFSVRLPFQLMVLAWIVNVGVSIALVEPRYAKHQPTSVTAHVRSLFAFVARRAPRLRALFIVGVVIGLANFVPVWLVQIYATDAGVPVSWLGPIWAIANYVVALGSLASPRVGARLGLVGVLLGCCGLIATGYFGMGLTTAWWGFVFYFCFNLSRGLSMPLLHEAEQREIPSGDRASLVSLRSLLFRLGFLALGPAVGAAIDVSGQRPILIALGFAFVTGGLIACALLQGTTSRTATVNEGREAAG